MRLALSLAVWMSVPLPALAYSANDARYVLGKGRPAGEAAYVVCLEKLMRGSTDIQTSLAKAAKACATAAPKAARAEEIRMQILECGFKKGDASPDAGC